MEVMFESKYQAYAALRADLLSRSWQKMYLLAPAQHTKLKITYPVFRTRHSQAYSGQGQDVEVMGCSITIMVKPAKLGRLVRLAAKQVTLDNTAYGGDNKWMRGKMTQSLRYMVLCNDMKDHFANLKPATREEATEALAVEDPEEDGELGRIQEIKFGSAVRLPPATSRGDYCAGDMPLSAVEVAVLTLVGLLMCFCFAMAVYAITVSLSPIDN